MSTFLSKFGSFILVLTTDEAAFLNKHGQWLEGLEAGVKLPSTVLQHQFLAAIRGEREATEFAEKLWLRLSAARVSARNAEEARESFDRASAELIGKDEIVGNLTRELDNHKRWLAALRISLGKYEPIPEPEVHDFSKPTQVRPSTETMACRTCLMVGYACTCGRG